MFESRDEAISELLETQGLVRPAQLRALRQSALSARESLADAIVRFGVLAKDDLLAAVARQVGGIVLPNLPSEIPPSVAAAVPRDLALARRILPVEFAGAHLRVAAENPFSLGLVDELTFALGREIHLVISDSAEVTAGLEAAYGAGQDAGERPVAASAHYTVADLESMAGQPPVIRLVDAVLVEAIRQRASDIHLEPFAREFRIRLRVDGALREFPPPARDLSLPMAARIKVLANLDVAERRLPQDGRIRVQLEGRPVDLRVSTLPTQAGESVVVRLLDPSAVRLGLADLGMPPAVLAGVRETLRRPHGLFVVTGPTGSGKTTTLYSGLREINAPGMKLLTAEDPVEYGVEGVMQVSMNPAAGLTFASAMRSFLRQDPDVIMVGEIRDRETAQIAIQAALTGHLVLSTLHTNDAPGAVTRLIDLGIEPFLVAATLEGVLAQRLVRRVCPSCRMPRQHGGDTGGHESFIGRGCEACGFTGYRGRGGIYEWLPLTGALREIVSDPTSVADLKRYACAHGMRTLREEGMRLVEAGETTIEEVLRHT